MPPTTPKLLDDISDSASFILSVTAGRTLEDYIADRLLRQAVERNFEIIGEAMTRLARTDSSSAARIDEHRQIIAFRNILSHGYDVIDDAAVWHVIQHDLATLAEQVAELITEIDLGEAP
jgi:uncharacterized protein with HEPN domain